MNFLKPEFTGFFLVVFFVYWAIGKHRLRMLWLLGASGCFYLNWCLEKKAPYLFLLLVGSTSIDYFLGMVLDRTESAGRRKLCVALSVIANLTVLGFFKYTLFVLNTASVVGAWFGAALPRPTFELLLPLGISFYTFEAISYIVEVYRRKVRAIRNPLDYALYIFFFPHLLAGPIVRPRDFLPQVSRLKRFNWPRLEMGIRLFLLGLFKKAVLADRLAVLVVEPVFGAPAVYNSAALWLAVLGYAAQIYCDFSGYSDMAIGLAHMLGFKLPANFRMPYFAADIADFWRRWHISLSQWLRDYLYIPLGGNRGSTGFVYRNLMLTMMLGGLWHGASWTFILWGAYHGLLLVLHRAIRLPAFCRSSGFRPVAIAFTFLLVCIGWVFFRAPTLAEAGCILRGLFVPTAGMALVPGTVAIAVACLMTLLAGHLIGSLGNPRKWLERAAVPVAGAVMAAAWVAYLLLVPGTSAGFIYFEF